MFIIWLNVSTSYRKELTTKTIVSWSFLCFDFGRLFMKYDVIVIGAGPGGIFSAYELVQKIQI